MDIVDGNELRRVMRGWATGVTLVTSHFQGSRHGMTVSSFTSISLDPPLVVVSLEHNSRTHLLVKQSNIFGITVLSTQQQPISDCFAGRTCDDDDRFTGLETFTLVTGAPLLPGGLAYFDCRLVDTYAAGTHTLFIGQVIAVQRGIQGEPLIYFDRNYRRLQ